MSKYCKPLIIRTKEQEDTLKQYAIDNKLPKNIYQNFTTFAKCMVPKWGSDKLDWQWFHDYMADGFNGLIFGDHSFLTCEIGPQHGKTVLTSLAMTYIMGSNPSLQLMYFTYSEKRAVSVIKGNVLKFMATDLYKTIFPHILLKADLQQKNKDAKQLMQSKSATLTDSEFTLSSPFGTNYLGKLVALGIGQGVHGRACDVGFLDDFCANLADSRSETMRQRLYEWYSVDWISRLQPNVKMVVTCTRWYEDDPVGLLQKDIRDLKNTFGDDAPIGKEIKIRTEYRKNDNNPVQDPRTQDGDILWDAMAIKYFLAKKSPDFEALYNCNPEALENLKQLKESDFGYYDALPKTNGRLVYSIDGAATANKKSDKTAIGLWFIVGLNRYLIKLWYVKLEVPDLINLVKSILNEQSYDDCLIEYASSGIPLYQFLKEANYKCTAIGFSGYEINNTDKKQNSDKIGKSHSKLDRYLRVLPEFVALDKRIWIPREPIEHQKDFVHQMTTFTGVDGRSDDLVDMATQLIFYTMKNVIHVNYTVPNNRIDKNKFAFGKSMCYNIRNNSFMNYQRGNING